MRQPLWHKELCKEIVLIHLTISSFHTCSQWMVLMKSDMTILLGMSELIDIVIFSAWKFKCYSVRPTGFKYLLEGLIYVAIYSVHNFQLIDCFYIYFQHYFPKIHSNIIFPSIPRFYKWSLPFRFPIHYMLILFPYVSFYCKVNTWKL